MYFSSSSRMAAAITLFFESGTNPDTAAVRARTA
jgi:hypothetical protein